MFNRGVKLLEETSITPDSAGSEQHEINVSPDCKPNVESVSQQNSVAPGGA